MFSEATKICREVWCIVYMQECCSSHVYMLVRRCDQVRSGQCVWGNAPKSVGQFVGVAVLCLFPVKMVSGVLNLSQTLFPSSLQERLKKEIKQLEWVSMICSC